MSNKVWVTWKDAAGGDPLFDKVTNLEDGADVCDLLRTFVTDRKMNEVDPATLSVFETEGGKELSQDATLDNYFTATSESSATLPGQSKKMALVVTFRQQHPNGK
jgi:aspartyl/asparaginyl-tRNA synthetase